MLGKLALLLKSKLVLAVVGTILVAGGGTTVAMAASGAHLQVPLVPQAQSQQQDNDTADDHGNQQGTNHDGGQQAAGTVSSIDTGRSTFVLTPEHGSTVHVAVNAQTVFDGGLSSFGSLNVGLHVEVNGTLQSDGSLLATKVEEHSETADDDQGQNDDQDNNENELKGTVVSVDSGKASFLLKLADGTTKTIMVSATTAFDGGFQSFADIKAGELAQVTGNLQSNSTVAATRVHREDDISGGDNGGSNGTAGGSGDGRGRGDNGSGSGDGH